MISFDAVEFIFCLHHHIRGLVHKVLQAYCAHTHIIGIFIWRWTMYVNRWYVPICYFIVLLMYVEEMLSHHISFFSSNNYYLVTVYKIHSGVILNILSIKGE